MFTGLIRTVILYILIIAGVRMMGKRQVGELEPSELVLSLIIADLASVPMQDYGIPLLTGVVPILTLLSVTMILSVLTMKSVAFRALLCGRPSMVVQNGTLVQARDLKVSVEEGGLPRVVVSDGRLLEQNLKILGHDRPWLDRQLAQRGCRDLSKVFLLLVDEADAIYFVQKDESA